MAAGLKRFCPHCGTPTTKPAGDKVFVEAGEWNESESRYQAEDVGESWICDKCEFNFVVFTYGKD